MPYMFEVQSKYYRSDNQDGTSDGSPDAANQMKGVSENE